MIFKNSGPANFRITIEVVPPETHDPRPLLDILKLLVHLPFDGFSVATNPLARPRMSAMAFCHLLQRHTLKPAILHCAVRDHNRAGIQSELWGARALDITTVIALTGDKAKTSNAIREKNLDVYALIRISSDTGMDTGCVLDFRPEINGLESEITRLEQKKAAGAGFVVTQPVYDLLTAERIQQAAAFLDIPVIMGILPLVSGRHARFLHEKVAGIQIPELLLNRMEKARNPLEEGVVHAKTMLDVAREFFSGACIMPPFDKFDILKKIIAPS